MNAAEFDATIGHIGTPEQRLTWFAALLAREAGTYVEVVGGSAIEVYLSSSAYVSEDVGLVGDRRTIEDVLRRWHFREMHGRSQRSYWFKPAIGLVDLVGPVTRSGLPPSRFETPFGPALVSAVEPLIVRRLLRAQREHSAGLFRQAVALSRLGKIDWEYLEAEAKFERVGESLRRLRKDSVPRAPRGRHRRSAGKR